MNDRKFLSVEELDSMLSAGESVHTFVSSGAMLLGCDMQRTKILELAGNENGAELSGSMATAMNHGALVWDKGTAIFVETKK